MDTPRLKEHFRLELIEPDAAILLAESRHEVLSGRVYHALLPLLHGQRSLPEIFQALDGTLSPPEVLYTLHALQRRGLLANGNGHHGPNGYLTGWWHRLGVDSDRAVERLAATPIQLIALGQRDARPLKEALLELGACLSDSDPALRVVVTDDYLHAGMDAINRSALESGTPWLLVKETGRLLWVGPLFVPGQSACWACMAQRIQGNRQVESYILRRTGRSDPLPTSRPGLSTTREIAIGIAANEIIKWIVTGRNERVQGRLLTVDSKSMELAQHVVVRRPQCPACGDAERYGSARTPVPPTLRSCRKQPGPEGGYRTRLPEESYAATQHHISPITGMISALERVANTGPNIFAYNAGHNFAMVRDDMSLLQKNLRSQSGGKGATQIQAMVSGICEAMERYSAVYREGEQIERVATKAEIGESALDLRDLLLFSERQYAERMSWNQQLHTSFHIVPAPYDPSMRLSWAPIWSLTEGRFRHIPSCYCFYGHPDLLRLGVSGSDSNGCAAGNTLEEAVLQGFLELAERDAVGIWWHNQIPRPGVDLASFGVTWIEQMVEHYRSIHRTLWAVDLTNDLGIPTFAALSSALDRPHEDILLGFGAHLEPRIALTRAITEVNQYLPNVLGRLPDGRTDYWVNDPAALNWLQNATRAAQPYLMPDPTLAQRRSSDYAPYQSDDLLDDIRYCVGRAASLGLETLLLDYSPPDIEIATCRVVVPGLRHMWRRLAPGRLYDVPVSLGWLDHPRTEAEMNPYSIFF